MTAPRPRSYVVNCSILFTDVALPDRPAAAAAAGFTQVEFWWPFPTATPAAADVDAFVDSLDAAGVQLIALNSFAGDMPGGERGIASAPHRVAEFADNLDVLVAICATTGCRRTNVLYGNRSEDVDPDLQAATALANLRLAADQMARLDGTVLIEAVNAPAYPLRTAADAVAVVRAVGRDNVRFLFDTFHLAAGGDDVLAVLAAHRELIGHVQLADFPGRGAPGTGGLDFTAIRSGLPDGVPVALEYVDPVPSGGSRFGWLDEEPTQ